MAYKIILSATLILFCLSGNAQLGNILNKAKNKTQQRIDSKIDQTIDKGLDKAEGKDNKKSNKSTQQNNDDSDENVSEKPVSDGKSFSNFAKFDFIPGDSIIYAEDFSQDELGELPLNWNTSGTGEVSTLDGIPGKWLRLHKQFRYLSNNTAAFGENFTFEFDIVLQLKTTGWMYPNIKVGLFATEGTEGTSNEFLRNQSQHALVEAELNPGESRYSRASIASYLEQATHYTSSNMECAVMEKFYFKPLHISFHFQKERLRMWVNSEKMFDIPKAVPLGKILNQIIFSVGSTNYDKDSYGVYISNLKVATGKPDTRHKLMEEGKFSTTGILFDMQSAVVKPESYAVVKEIAGVLKQHNDLRIKVVGHTSSDGDDKANMELSDKRAAAVKNILVSEFKIDGSRIETQGKGETEPVADNSKREGKIANRRVEFIKL